MASSLATPQPTLHSPLSLLQLPAFSAQARLDALAMIYNAQSGHPGTSFSCQDMLTYLWARRMRHSASQPDWAERDRFILSKGHGAPALYATLIPLGYIPAEEKLTLRKAHSNLQGHPASKYVAGVDVSTGSLGQGLSCGVGMALGHRLDGIKANVYVVMGDGECQEGNIWEAAMSAPHHKLTRLIGIVDRNCLQIDGNTESIKALGNIGDKFRAFGWNVLTLEDGHDFTQMEAVFDEAERYANSPDADKPTLIVAKTVKGKGVSFMENQAGWHGKAPNAEQYAQAVTELEALLAQASN